jgi:hypothetical protein
MSPKTMPSAQRDKVARLAAWPSCGSPVVKLSGECVAVRPVVVSDSMDYPPGEIFMMRILPRFEVQLGYAQTVSVFN